MGRFAVRALIYLSAAVVVVAVAGAIYGHARLTSPGPLVRETTVVIPKGHGPGGIAAVLAGAGVISDTTVFRLGARLTGRDRSMRAGEFAFPAGISMDDAIALLTTGKTVKRRVTVAEGLTTAEILRIVGVSPRIARRISGRASGTVVSPSRDTWPSPTSCCTGT